MTEEIAESVSRLNIDEEEDEVIDLNTLNPNPENVVSLLLVGRLLTERNFNVEAFKRTITTVWAPVHGLVIRVLKPNLFAFQFFHWRDMLKVLEGRPWCFDNMLVVLKEAEGDEQPDQVSLFSSPFWIRLKNLPFNMRSNDVVKALIGNMGEILDIEEDVLGFGRYRRVKVMLDITKPLRRYRKLRDKNGKDLQIDFAYERLPFFCLACGVMGHSEKDCQSVTEEERCEKLGWNLGLKATPRKGITKEIEEETKFKNCKKVLFEDAVASKREIPTIKPLALKNQVDAPIKLCVKKDPKIALNALVEVSEVQPPLVIMEQVDLSLNISGDPSHNAADFSNFSGDLSHNVAVPAMNKTKENFVFSATKVSKGVKAVAWKRLARGPMEEKGVQRMDLDNSEVIHKRSADGSLLFDAGEVNEGYEDGEGTLKRQKLSISPEFVSFVSVEVGDDQPRPSL